MTAKIVNCLKYFQRNVFLQERRNNMDCSCILTSLTKICLNPSYRTIAGFENLIQKDWFLTGHMFLKRLHPTSNNPSNDDFIELVDKRRSSQDSNVSNTAGNTGEDTSSTNKSDVAPTFLLFLDCIFQLIIQYPSEFEFNEFYLINLWDYSLTGLSCVYSFNGMSDLFSYLNNITFLTTDTLVSNINKNTMPKFDNTFLKDIFGENNKYWLNHLDKSNCFYLNKFYQLNPKKDSLLIPCEKIYLLKFWSRCYLRWVEKFHTYNSIEQNEKSNEEVEGNIQHPHRPPPVPPKPKLTQPSSSNSLTIRSDEATNTKVISVHHAGSILVTTRITPDGNIESSF